MLSIFDQSKTSTTQTSPDHFSGVAFTTGNHGYSIFKDERECRPLPLEVIWQTFTLGMDYCNFTGAWKDPQCVYKSHKKDPQCVYKSHVANKTVHLGWPNSCLPLEVTLWVWIIASAPLLICVYGLLQLYRCLKRPMWVWIIVSTSHTKKTHCVSTCFMHIYINYDTQKYLNKIYTLNWIEFKLKQDSLLQLNSCLRRPWNCKCTFSGEEPDSGYGLLQLYRCLKRPTMCLQVTQKRPTMCLQVTRCIWVDPTVA